MTQDNNGCSRTAHKGEVSAAGLSVREASILELVAQGLTNAEIAGRLYLSINTVKTCIRTAYRTMGVDRRSQAVGWAMDRGFVSGPPPVPPGSAASGSSSWTSDAGRRGPRPGCPGAAGRTH